MPLRSQKKHRQQRMPFQSFPLQKWILKKASIPNPKWPPVSATTTAMGTRWVMLKNLGTAQEVSGSADPVRERPAASRRPRSWCDNVQVVFAIALWAEGRRKDKHNERVRYRAS